VVSEIEQILPTHLPHQSRAPFAPCQLAQSSAGEPIAQRRKDADNPLDLGLIELGGPAKSFHGIIFEHVAALTHLGNHKSKDFGNALKYRGQAIVAQLGLKPPNLSDKSSVNAH
jgi:hypothetical protein